MDRQESMFQDPGGIDTADWDRDEAQRALDELFHCASEYRSSVAFHDLMQFIARFPLYSPFNAMLAHIQMPGARFVAPPHRWLRGYGRRIKSGARPLVLLQPMGPVMFAFDVSDTEPLPDAPALPRDVENPSASDPGGSATNSIGRSRTRHAMESGSFSVTLARRAQDKSGLRVGVRRSGSS